MTFQPADDCVQAIVKWNIGSHVAENVFHIQKGAFTTPLTSSQLTATHAAFDSFLSSYLSQCNAIVSSIQVAYKDITAADQLEVILAAAHTSATGGSTQGANSAVLGQLIAGGGRHGKGRIFLPPVAGNLVGSDQWPASTITAVNGYLNTLRTALASASHPLVVLSRRASGALRPTAVWNTVTVCNVDGKVHSQRRRLRS